MIETLARDLRSAWRFLTASPGWTTVAVASLALGIGATTVVFSLVESVLLRPFPYAQPDRIVLLSGPIGSDSAADLFDYRDQSTTFEAFGLYSDVRMRSPDGGGPVAVGDMNTDVLRVLGVRPLLGPGFPPREEMFVDRAGEGFVAAIQAQPPSLVLLGHGFWQRQYAGDPDIVGTTLRLGGVPHEIVGVMPPGFFFPAPDVALWTPLRAGIQYYGVARLAPGTPLATAQAEINVISRRLDEQYPRPQHPRATEAPRRTASVISIRDAAVGDYRTVLWLLLGAVVLVLLIACVNVANLLLARSAGRTRALAVRATLGASRAALMRQLVIESVCLALLGGLVGVAVAVGGLRLVLGLGLVEVPRLADASINVVVLLFALGIALATGLLAGVAPAWTASRVDLTGALKQGGPTAAQAGRAAFRHALVVGEVAIAVLLLVGAGLLVRSAVAIGQVDWGFDPDGLSLMVIRPADTEATSARWSVDESNRVANVLLERLRAMPGVVAAGAGTAVPLSVPGSEAGERVVAEGDPVTAAVTATRRLVTPGYLTALAADLRGRDFDARDAASAPKTIVLSQSLARALFPGRDAVGQTVHLAALTAAAGQAYPVRGEDVPTGGSADIADFEVTGATAHAVIGVVADLRMTGDLSRDAATPAIYLDVRQVRDRSHFNVARLALDDRSRHMRSFVVRASRPPVGMIDAMHAAVAEHPTLTLQDAATMRQLVSRSLGGAGESGLVLALSTVFGALSILLAAVGIYGVISHGVSQRQREIGVRMAIGARPGEIAGMVLGHGLRLAAIGLAIGLATAWAGSRMLESRLFGVTPTDLVTFAGVTLFLLAIACAACLIPARRAARIDPLVAVKAD